MAVAPSRAHSPDCPRSRPRSARRRVFVTSSPKAKSPVQSSSRKTASGCDPNRSWDSEATCSGSGRAALETPRQRLEGDVFQPKPAHCTQRRVEPAEQTGEPRLNRWTSNLSQQSHSLSTGFLVRRVPRSRFMNAAFAVGPGQPAVHPAGPNPAVAPYQRTARE
jgi:hypothetical protein